MSNIINPIVTSLNGVSHEIVELAKSLFHLVISNLTPILGILVLVAIFSLLDDSS